MKKSVRFIFGDVTVALVYSPEKSSVSIAANHANGNPNPNDLMAITIIGGNGDSTSPDEHHFEKGNVLESYPVELLDRVNVYLYLTSGQKDYGIDVTAQGLRLN